MEYFVSICDQCDGCVVMAFPGGSLGAGVVKEAQSFLTKGKKVQEVKLDGERIGLRDVINLAAYKCLDVDSTRAMLAKLRPDYRNNPKL